MEKKITTLVLVHKENKILLGLKKRGFGVGRWNGFGGKLENGETVESAAKREVFEEAGIIISDLKKLGKLDFYWKDKSEFCLQVNIFKSKNFKGAITESEEMKPCWFNVKQIPYEKMWQDDTYWLPLLLSDKKFTGKFVFDDKDNILEKELNEIDNI